MSTIFSSNKVFLEENLESDFLFFPESKEDFEFRDVKRTDKSN